MTLKERLLVIVNQLAAELSKPDTDVQVVKELILKLNSELFDMRPGRSER